MPSTSCSINGPSLHSSRTLGSRHSIETGDRYLFHTNSSISKISVEPSGGMRIACTEHGDEILLILLHNPCLFLNRCKGTKNIIDKQIIFSILWVHFTESVKWTIIVEQTFNMPQTPMYNGFEACYINRLIDFANFFFWQNRSGVSPLIH